MNPQYSSTFVFQNDFPAVGTASKQSESLDLFQAQSVSGECRVLCFTPKHNLTMAEMSVTEIAVILSTWKDQIKQLSSLDGIEYIQVFENKGAVMG